MKNLFIIFILIGAKNICDGHDSLDDDAPSDNIDDLLNSVDLQSDDDPDKEDHIVNGVPISVQMAPYQVQLYRTWSHQTFCGGSIIHKEWILTAAHCLFEYQELKDKLVIYTGSSIRNRGQRHAIKNMILHKDYNQYTYLNDIALIQLNHSIIFDESQNEIEFIDRQVREGEAVFLSGFGSKFFRGKASDLLEAASVPVVNQESCAKLYSKTKNQGHQIQVTDGMFCAGNGKSDTCQGDSGGPAVIDHKLAGIVSFGMGCAHAIYPGIYTSVLKYREWIEDNTKVPRIGQKSEDDIQSRLGDENETDVLLQKIDDPPEDYHLSRVPYHAQVRGSNDCGGAIIDEYWVLTAAHCLAVPSGNKTEVLVGSMIHNGGIPQEVEKKIIHKKYNHETGENDIALIKLKYPVVYSEKVTKIKIGKKLPKKGKLLLIGYEKSINNEESEKLIASYTPKVSLKRCNNRMLCARTEKSNSCSNGSGGPLIINGELFGIVTSKCADQPSIYILVPEYLPWIESITHLIDV